MEFDFEQLPQYIDINGADGIYSFADVEAICDFAARYKCRSVTAAPCYINTVCKLLRSEPQIIKKSLIGAPYGEDMTSVKVYAAKQSEVIGAQIVEGAMNIGAFISDNSKYVKHELQALASNVEVIFAAFIDSGSMSIEETGKAADLAASVTQFVKISGGNVSNQEFIKKIERSYELSKGCIEITAKLREASVKDIAALKSVGAEFFSLNLSEAQKLFDEAGIKPPGYDY